MALPPITVTPDAAARAYAQIAGGTDAETNSAGAGTGFGDMLQRAVQGAIDAGHAADAQSLQAISGHADVTAVVTAVSKAELALQTTATIRDRVVAAYQDIMKMPI
jgi:flagellar hook-basal body complex protein FliE